MLSLATRMWDKYKHEDKKPEERKPTTYTKGKGPEQQTRDPQTPRQPYNRRNKDEDKAKGQKNPKEYASGINDKGERICYVYGSTEHRAFYHRKNNKDKADKDKADKEKGGPGQKEQPNVGAIKAGRKKGHERMAERVF